ncbi:hypothetical protein NL676_028912 [Syzygium grande]|nr:hypothetical protein NL676_028912 [Syzygium grande]
MLLSVAVESCALWPVPGLPSISFCAHLRYMSRHSVYRILCARVGVSNGTSVLVFAHASILTPPAFPFARREMKMTPLPENRETSLGCGVGLGSAPLSSRAHRTIHNPATAIHDN